VPNTPLGPREQGFQFERLDVYRLALEFTSFAHETASALPRGHAGLADQLERAAASIVLNTAEGAGEFSRKEKARFFRMALRSSAECAAVLAVSGRLGLISPEQEDRGRQMTYRLAAMLTRLVLRQERL